MRSPSKTKIGLHILAIALIFCVILIVLKHQNSVVGDKLDKKINISSDLTYNQVVNSETKTLPEKLYKNTEFNNSVIEWQGKISAYYSQITGIKFCIVDTDHQNIDINKPCNLFWGSSKNIMDADTIAKNPDWDGLWVPYTLNRYGVQFNKNNNYYNEMYTVKGVIKGLDCALGNGCVPDIDIISITK